MKSIRLSAWGVLLSFLGGVAYGQQQWTWLYKKKFGSQEQEALGEKNGLTFYKLDIPAFTQLIFSWNALRPAKGYFTFAAQVRDAHSKQWYSWHKMMAWGANIQRSFLSQPGDGTSYCHVRLEMDKNLFADGFRIKIQAHDGADLADLKACAASVSDLTLHKPEIITQRLVSLPSVYIEGVPKLSQRILDHPRADHLCSPTSCTMLTSYLANRLVNPIECAEKSYDAGLQIYGSWPFNIAHAFEECGGSMFFAVARLNCFENIYQRLAQGIPVAVSVRGYLQGAAGPMLNGHFLVVVGWDAQTQQVICHDPAFESNKKTFRKYPIKSFLEAWERSISPRLAYVAELF